MLVEARIRQVREEGFIEGEEGEVIYEEEKK